MGERKQPTSKKIRGEGHWLPAVKGEAGPVPIAWTRHDSPAKAKAEAKRLLTEGVRLPAPLVEKGE